MLATRRAKSMVKLTYTCFHDEEPSYLYDRLVPVTHGARITRMITSGVLKEPRTHTIYGQYAFRYRAPLQWNITKIELKSAVNKVQLKNLLVTSW